MGIFKRSRDHPSGRSFFMREKRDNVMTEEMKDFVLGRDVDDSYGVYIDEDSAMRSSTVYACVRLISETVATLPCNLLKVSGKKREVAFWHPLESVLHDCPNEEMTSVSFWESMTTSLLLYGNAYAKKVVDNNGRTVSLFLLLPQYMKVDRDSDGELIYKYFDRVKSKNYVWKRKEIFHIIGLSLNGVTGLSPISYNAKSIGLEIATSEYGASFFKNSAMPSGVLEAKGIVKEPEKLRESWNKAYQGVKKGNKVAVLEEGLTYKPITISPQEAQYLDTRKFSANDIAKIFRVPPHMIGDLDRATFSNIEQQSIEFVQNTIRPWLVRIEKAIKLDLLNEGERTIYQPIFKVDGLLRGDIATRFAAYATARQNGWMSINEIRELEDLNPIPKEQGGDDYLVNSAMIPAGSQNNKKEE